MEWRQRRRQPQGSGSHPPSRLWTSWLQSLHAMLIVLDRASIINPFQYDSQWALRSQREWHHKFIATLWWSVWLLFFVPRFERNSWKILPGGETALEWSIPCIDYSQFGQLLTSCRGQGRWVPYYVWGKQRENLRSFVQLPPKHLCHPTWRKKHQITLDYCKEQNSSWSQPSHLWV